MIIKLIKHQLLTQLLQICLVPCPYDFFATFSWVAAIPFCSMSMIFS